MLRSTGLALVVVAYLSGTAASALAQDVGTSGGAGASGGTEVGVGVNGSGTGTGETGGAAGLAANDPGDSAPGATPAGDEGAMPAQARDSTDPHEDEHQGYWFAGPMMRFTVVPTFMERLFIDGGHTELNPATGLEATYRKDNFDIVMSVWWASFAFTGPFRASGDPDTDTEIVSGNPSVVFASAAFMWSTPFNDMFALEYGLDVGVGVVLGDVVRYEAYPGGPDNIGGYSRCASPGNPSSVGGAPLDPAYCDGPPVGDGMRGGHYNVIARKWTDGGSVPNVVPWLAIPHLAIRFKPVHQFMARIDFGFGLGFFFGGSLNYGF